ncbi:hypothetical protein [Streptomyces sp. NPDC048636]|uniref:hypothetical protein n=1 Tax=Streptomyces sp. NPDC048636 TaxID=3155762 RepID=UPI003417899A
MRSVETADAPEDGTAQPLLEFRIPQGVILRLARDEYLQEKPLNHLKGDDVDVRFHRGDGAPARY